MKFPKANIVRSGSYRRFVAGFGCFECGVEGRSQAAHPNQWRGLGQKTSDIDCFPLCAPTLGDIGCHARHDQLIGMSLEQRRAREVRYIERMHKLAGDQGRKEFE